ncbi:hypothetical protein ZWY2020_003494 [Hordeum vulgare]|nr:hypothetical protein ZWY2020_003494 [Hordeum vulgare]
MATRHKATYSSPGTASYTPPAAAARLRPSPRSLIISLSQLSSVHRVPRLPQRQRRRGRRLCCKPAATSRRHVAAELALRDHYSAGPERRMEAAPAPAAAETQHRHGGCLSVKTFMPPGPVARCSSQAAGSSDQASCGSPRWIGKSLSCVCIKRKGAYERICVNLTPVQEQRLQRLRHRMKVYFDHSRRDHQEALRALWYATYPDQELQGLVSEQWKDMGWQGRDPSTDFRGAGFISLENLLFFAKTFSASYQRLLQKQCGNRATWEYPFAVAGVNITFMIMQMLDLQSTKPRAFVKAVLSKCFQDEWAFDLLYCVAFLVMDKQWVELNDSYMVLNEILKSASAAGEELLLDDVMRIEDMPSYRLLC